MLPDYLKHGLKAVFVGTAAGNRSAAVGHYYAGRGNRFWATLHECGLTSELLSPERDSDITTFGLGLTDIAKGQSGMDKDIAFDRVDRVNLFSLVEEFSPRSIAFNGKKAAEVVLEKHGVDYGVHALSGLPPVWVLPSTSGAARSHFDIGVWRSFAGQLAIIS